MAADKPVYGHADQLAWVATSWMSFFWFGGSFLRCRFALRFFLFLGFFDQAFAMAFQEGAGLDSQVLVQNVADDVGGFRQLDGTRFDLAVDGTMHAYGFGDDLAFCFGRLADEQGLGANVTFDDAVDLDFPFAAEVTDDLEIGADQRWRRRLRRCGRRCRIGTGFLTALGKHIVPRG